MKQSKLVIGNKYVPHAKTAGVGDLDQSTVWQSAKKSGQNFLYFLGENSDGDLCFNDEMKDYLTGDFFSESDVKEFLVKNPHEIKYRHVYEILVNASTLQVGDIVEVTHIVPDYDLGWANIWVEEMDKSVGEQFTISEIDNRRGCMLRNEKDGSFSYSFPVHVLKFISKGPEFKQIRINDDHIAKVFSDRIEVGRQVITLAKFNELAKLVKEMSK